MVLAALSLFTLRSTLPENASFDYSGLPILAMPQAVSGPVRVESQSVTFTIDRDSVAVSSVTLFKNEGKAFSAQLIIPVRRVQPDSIKGAPDQAAPGSSPFGMAATWDKQPIHLVYNAQASGVPAAGNTKLIQFNRQYAATVNLTAKGTHALRVNYTVPLGRCGFDFKQKIVGYDFGPSSTIGTLHMAFNFTPRAVFNLPEIHPNWGWQVSAKGAFIKRTNFTPNAELVYMTFYPGGFRDIGG